eukprot:6249582-Amphidinium_carterae.1
MRSAALTTTEANQIAIRSIVTLMTVMCQRSLAHCARSGVVQKALRCPFATTCAVRVPVRCGALAWLLEVRLKVQSTLR